MFVQLSKRGIFSISLLMLLVAVLGTGCESLSGTADQTSTSGTVNNSVTEVSVPVELDGLGDEYLPQAGNAGYDVLHYDIALDCDPQEGDLVGTVAIEAEATMPLERFHLDFSGMEIASVRVDGTSAEYQRDGRELIVDCPQPLATGDGFSVEVTYEGSPQPLRAAQGYWEGWQRSGDTIFTLDEPEGASTWYPLNDHPCDKATYSFRLTVPEPYVALANGVLVDIQDLGEERVFTWEMEQPMANYLASVVVGEMVLEEDVSPSGVPIRNYFAIDLADAAGEAFASTGEALDFFSGLFGPYPFDTYGVAVVDASTDGSAMENQTMSLFGRDTLEGPMSQDFYAEWFLSHELAHAWFGNSVTLAGWKDTWLNEGFANYASWLWVDQQFEGGMEACVEDALYAVSRNESALPGDPGLQQLFGTAVYDRGGLTLRALHLSVGDDLFFSILREWVETNAYGNVSTRDLIDLVKARTAGVVGFDAESFFDSWLYEEGLPDLPVAATNS